MFPTKTIEYLFSGRPILAHTPPGCFLTEFLRAHACALVIDRADPEVVMEGVSRIVNDDELRASLVRNALVTAGMFRAEEVASHLRHVLCGDKETRA